MKCSLMISAVKVFANWWNVLQCFLQYKYWLIFNSEIYYPNDVLIILVHVYLVSPSSIWIYIVKIKTNSVLTLRKTTDEKYVQIIFNDSPLSSTQYLFDDYYITCLIFTCGCRDKYFHLWCINVNFSAID